jgi:tRNA(fMet)-specific endonuclease VapC
VADALILETTFLIDLEREIGRGVSGPAQRLLEDHPQAKLYITFTVAGELAAGRPLGERGRWEDFIRPFEMLSCTPDVCWEYGKAFRYLKENGLLIGANDIWIAATGVALQMPVVTRNTGHFRRVPNLEVVGYAES